MTSVLVLDDRPADRELLSTVLGYAGYDVLEASTAAEALRLTKRELPDLIITDLLMPNVNGYEFVRALRADEEVSHTKVIFCTATYAEDELRRLADASGVERVLVKPCDPQEILRVVAEVVGSEDESGTRMVLDRFDREQLRVLNDKLVEKVNELERAGREQQMLHEELRRAERQSAEALTLLETLLSTAPVGFSFVDREMRVVRINETMAGANGITVEGALGRPLEDVAPEIWRQVKPFYRSVLETGVPITNREFVRPLDGSDEDLGYWLASYYPVRLKDEVIGVGVVGVEITERRQADDFRSAVMQTMAEGLYVTDAEDRLLFMNAAASRLLGWSEEELQGNALHALIHFQREDGSPLAEEDSELSRLLSEGRTVRVTDDAFTRKDGSIFPVAYSAAPLLAGTKVRGSVVVFRDTIEEKAEQAQIKRELASLAWVGRIRDALDDDRLVLYAQRIVPLNGGSASEELLIRMIGQRGEIVEPASFLPSAEKYKLIAEVDRWVLTEGLRLAATGRRVHINLSADSITDGELLANVQHGLRDTGADCSNVVFEITETAIMSDLQAAEACVRGLAELGFGVAIDDFGTGYGSFTYLQLLPITHLKIDRAFVGDLVSSSANQHVVKAIVNLAKGFGQRTVAEGVEDPAALALLEDYGVDYAQGFHIGRPEPVVY